MESELYKVLKSGSIENLSKFAESNSPTLSWINTHFDQDVGISSYSDEFLKFLKGNL